MDDRGLGRERKLDRTVARTDVRAAEDCRAQVDSVAPDEKPSPVLAAPERPAQRSLAEVELDRRPHERDLVAERRQQPASLLGENGRHLLVRVGEDEPWVASLPGNLDPRPFRDRDELLAHDARPCLLRDGDRVVGRLEVDDDDLVAEPERRETAAELLRLVPARDERTDRQARRTGHYASWTMDA